MADLMPLNFPVPSPRAIPSYDAVNIGLGVGFIGFNLVDVGQDDGVANTFSYFLTTESFYGKQGYWRNDSGASTDKDFDITINKSMIVEGQLIFNISHGLTCDAAISRTYVLKFRKYSASTETEIADVTLTVSKASAGSQFSPLVGVVNVSATKFNVGDILRLSIIGSETNTGNNYSDFGTQPTNIANITACLTTFSKSTLYVPVRVIN